MNLDGKAPFNLTPPLYCNPERAWNLHRFVRRERVTTPTGEFVKINLIFACACGNERTFGNEG